MIPVSAAGALKRKTTNALCKDLGVLTPNCMVIKVRQSGLCSGNNPSAVGALTTGTAPGGSAADRAYNIFLRLFPFGGASGLLANVTDHSGAGTAWTEKAANAVGASRLVGTVGSTALYKVYTTLRVQGYITLEFSHSNGTVISDAADIAHVPTRAGVHFYHVRDVGETAPTVPTSQALCDISFAQPDYRRKLTTGLPTGDMAYRTTIPDEKASFGYVQVPSTTVKWKVDHWIHKILDMSYPSYVSDGNSFAALNAAPTNYAILDLMGYFNSFYGVRQPPTVCYMRYNLVWSVLLKDPLPNISN